MPLTFVCGFPKEIPVPTTYCSTLAQALKAQSTGENFLSVFYMQNSVKTPQKEI